MLGIKIKANKSSFLKKTQRDVSTINLDYALYILQVNLMLSI